MNKYEKEVMKYSLEREKEVISELKDIYRRALDEIGDKIRALMTEELLRGRFQQFLTYLIPTNMTAYKNTLSHAMRTAL